jgi:Pyruvate/2-oxoacid:ferredoxin oxidoreductase gamma subunit
MTAEQSETHVRDVLSKAFPIGIVKDEPTEPWFSLAKPQFSRERVLDVISASRESPARFCKQFPDHLDPMDVAVKLAGSGGDGAQTAALLVTKAAINEGFDATHIPSYGPESRGGTSYADVHIAREEVLSPGAPNPHVLMAFNAPSLDKFAASVKPGGIIIYDSSVIERAPNLGRDVRLVPVPCATLAQELGNVLVKNVIALGALQAAAQLLEPESFLTALRIGLQKKKALVPINEAAFRRGAAWVRDGEK